jgi:hypothetical protein
MTLDMSVENHTKRRDGIKRRHIYQDDPGDAIGTEVGNTTPSVATPQHDTIFCSDGPRDTNEHEV